ncbi:hypothetical protein DVH24_039408 [Malus domestica]|uniref:Uncharacterized protein n=1 Tax=Malus domestica TaxID=3750 RepID=A0A498HYJ9_MALDO|nr:hypothetical protein DVH24_039408 [Malus domestica]
MRLLMLICGHPRVGESIKGEIVTSTSRIMRREEIGEMEASAAAATHIYFHPYYYFRLATLAFLKCRGFDSTSEYSSTHKEEREKKVDMNLEFLRLSH